MSPATTLHQSTFQPSSDIVQGQPHLTLSNSTRTLALDIPALREDSGIGEPHWEVQEWDLEGHERTREFFAPVGEAEPLLVALSKPFQRLRVALTDGGEEVGAIEFQGATSENPYIILDTADRVVDPQQLNPARYSVLALGEGLAHGEWTGWNVRHVDLRGADKLELNLPYRQVTLPVGTPAAFEWDTDAKTLPNARGLDHEPVYTQSPRVVINEPGEWTVSLEYAPIGGERELVSEEHVEPGNHEIFPGDLYEDPWVGRYEVTVARDGEVQDARYFSIVEALHMRAHNEGPRGMDFRFIDALGNLSPFSYNLASAPGKAVVFEKGTRTFEPLETSRVETVGSHAGYELDFRVLPATLRMSVKRTGVEPVSYFDKQEILAGQLDAKAQFTVYAPRPLPLAKFVAIDKRQKIKEVGSIPAATEARAAFSIPNTALQSALRKQSTAELFLMWSTLTYDDYLAQLDAGAREAHLAQPLERRIVEYEASASADLVYAALATLRRTPLIARATLEDGAIEVEQSLEEPVELLGWAWALNNPAVPGIPMEATETGFAVPEELKGAGPLLIDLREDEYLSDVTAPARPAASSLFVGSGESSAPVLDDAASAWRTYHSLFPVAQRTRATEVHDAFAQAVNVLRKDPRAALAALGESPLRAGERAHALVSTGLIAYPTEGLTPLGALDDAPAPLQEVLASGVDSVTQPLLLMSAGGPAPTPASAEACDAGARIAALREVFAADAQIAALGGIGQLRKDATVLGNAIAPLFDKSVGQTLMAFEAFASGDNPLAAAAWVPYMSYAFALTARAMGNGLVTQAAVLGILNNSLEPLAELYALVPQLFACDFTVAEAITLHAGGNA